MHSPGEKHLLECYFGIEKHTKGWCWQRLYLLILAFRGFADMVVYSPFQPDSAGIYVLFNHILFL